MIENDAPQASSSRHLATDIQLILTTNGCTLPKEPHVASVHGVWIRQVPRHQFFSFPDSKATTSHSNLTPDRKIQSQSTNDGHDTTHLRQHEGAPRAQPVRDEVLRHRAHEPPDHLLPHVVEDARGHLEPVAGGLKALLATAVQVESVEGVVSGGSGVGTRSTFRRAYANNGRTGWLFLGIVRRGPSSVRGRKEIRDNTLNTTAGGKLNYTSATTAPRAKSMQNNQLTASVLRSSSLALLLSCAPRLYKTQALSKSSVLWVLFLLGLKESPHLKPTRTWVIAGVCGGPVRFHFSATEEFRCRRLCVGCCL